ncbi:hypothetical protein [Pontibacter chinhatensis]|uniref:Uncharacterized protein n=1 Tax=Pontibacter chinhatensis TaxID=1436961 RepID=A0A1I2ZRC5_9BACT|nr:hypothetical protein [Pontibacter chinhatensis]SFH40442.1 hypothetical protein SAMN05421739_1186 [Pontibacter chinhatensis]
MHKTNEQSHSLKISEEASAKILEIQLILKKQLRKHVSKKQVITSSIRALEEKMGLIVNRKEGEDE